MRMNGFLQHVALGLRLHGRNRMALVYGHLFPLLFLGVFAVLYRHETLPLIGHLGEWLTISVLGGACFGLPTTLVSERERGVWRRYRLAPVAPGLLIAGTITARFVLILSAAVLQLGLAIALGMPLPANLPGLLVAFAFTAWALIGLGLVIAALADTVPAVQALGQCVFLPMLVIGGVAVPLAALPEWAQHASAFLPGRYAVAALQACATETGQGASLFNLLALAVTGAAGFVAGLKLFRWESGRRGGVAGGRVWVLLVVVAWLAVGLTAIRQDQSLVRARVAEPVTKPMIEPWRTLDLSAIEQVNFAMPYDDGVVSPFAGRDEPVDPGLQRLLDGMRGRLREWPPAREGDPVQRVRNLLNMLAQCDIAQLPVERHAPVLVLEHLEATMPKEDLVRVLLWIIQHPKDGTVAADLTGLGLGWYATDEAFIRSRANFYAVKFLARLTGRVPW